MNAFVGCWSQARIICVSSEANPTSTASLVSAGGLVKNVILLYQDEGAVECVMYNVEGKSNFAIWLKYMEHFWKTFFKSKLKLKPDKLFSYYFFIIIIIFPLQGFKMSDCYMIVMLWLWGNPCPCICHNLVSLITCHKLMLKTDNVKTGWLESEISLKRDTFTRQITF